MANIQSYVVHVYKLQAIVTSLYTYYFLNRFMVWGEGIVMDKITYVEVAVVFVLSCWHVLFFQHYGKYNIARKDKI